MKRLLILIFLVFLTFGVTGCTNVTEDDFKCYISVDKSTVKVGDTIKIIASIENISNKNIKIKANHTDIKEIEDIIMIGIFNENSNHDFIVNSKGGPLKRFNFAKNSLVTKELTIK